jgi:aldehyde dehydrogenase (NAD+)
MRDIDHIYVNGNFVIPRGDAPAPLFNPSTEEQIGTVRLGNAEDVNEAVAAARSAFPWMRSTSADERVDMLQQLAGAVAARADDLTEAMNVEYGAPPAFTRFSIDRLPDVFSNMAKTVRDYPFVRTIGNAQITMQPLGVVGAITPWNSNIGFICTKLATAIAAGSTIVIKPSEMSAIQTQVITEALHGAALPPGLFNIVNGYGHDVGAALSSHPDVAKVTFTGSTGTGRMIMRAAAETFKRVTLELGGKGPTIFLDDADLDQAIPQALMNGFMNSGQACIAGTRILVPQVRMQEIVAALCTAAAAIKVGRPDDPAVQIGPMVSEAQWERVQSYIRLGQEEGATLLTGGEGRPEGIDRGWFVRPTIFGDVTNDMRIAREEIFGPVLCVIPYADEDDAIRIANDTSYGLQSYVLSSDIDRAKYVADQLDAGRVMINGAQHEPLAPFGGFKQSGIGREYGLFGLDAFLEPRAVLS